MGVAEVAESVILEVVEQEFASGCLRGMGNLRRFLVGTLTAVTAAVTLMVVYHLGYRQGNKEALDWQFYAVVEGKVVPVGHGSSLLRSRVVPPKPYPSGNALSKRFIARDIADQAVATPASEGYEPYFTRQNRMVVRGSLSF